MEEPKIIKRAVECWYTWGSNYHRLRNLRGTGTIVYAETPSKARYAFNVGAENDSNTLFETRVCRWPDNDLVENPNRNKILDELTASQIAKMEHCIGNDFKTDKQPYRNYYQSKPGEDMDDLVKMGLARFYYNLNLPVYNLTEFGLLVIKSKHPITRARWASLNKNSLMK